MQNADLRIASANPFYSNEPYTIQKGDCGEPGEYIHITPEYIKDDSVAGIWDSTRGIQRFKYFAYHCLYNSSLGKHLVQEFAKYRWGVFEEFGWPGDSMYPIFYKDSNNAIKPAYCTNIDLNGGQM